MVNILPKTKVKGSRRRGYRPFSGGVAPRLATTIYVAMVTPILYDSSHGPNDSSLKYESNWPDG